MAQKLFVTVSSRGSPWVGRTASPSMARRSTSTTRPRSSVAKTKMRSSPRWARRPSRQAKLLALDAKTSDEKIKAYLAAGTVDEIVAQSSGYNRPGVKRLIELEEARKEPRQRLLDELRCSCPP